MGKIRVSKTYGIHTIELYLKNLKYAEVQKVIDYLMDKGEIQRITSDPYNLDRHLKSTYFVNDGLRLRIYQSHNRSNGIGFIVNPITLLSGKYQSLLLWKPTQGVVDSVLDSLIATMKSFGVDGLKPEDFSLSQMDITYNKRLDKAVNVPDYIHIYRKGMVPRNFKRLTIHNEEERKHLFVMKTKRIAFKIYDKIYELLQNDRCPKDLKEAKILRYELSLKREAYLGKFYLSRKDTLYDTLNTGFAKGQEALFDYLDELNPLPSCCVVKYKTAKQIIMHSVKDAKMQEQMLYLLKKTSDSAGLDAATRKLKEHYTDVDHRRIKKILAKFDELGISPITLPKS